MMEILYDRKGIVCLIENEYLIQYGTHTKLNCLIHPNQTIFAKSLIGNNVNFRITVCPDMKNGGELGNFAILENIESSDRIQAAMKALKGKEFFMGLNDHAMDILTNWNTTKVTEAINLSDYIRLYVNEQIELGNIEKSEKTWLENVCMYWYNEGKNGKK